MGMILVMLAYIQLKSLYHLSTHDITHMRKCTRPSPTCTASDRKLGEGLGMRLVVSAGGLHVQET